jgi:hypothetical protein
MSTIHETLDLLTQSMVITAQGIIDKATAWAGKDEEKKAMAMSHAAGVKEIMNAYQEFANQIIAKQEVVKKIYPH